MNRSGVRQFSQYSLDCINSDASKSDDDISFGALAFGIGTSEVEHVLATQTFTQTKGKNMQIRVDGELSDGVTSKDTVLHVCGLIGTAGGTGYTIEFGD